MSGICGADHPINGRSHCPPIGGPNLSTSSSRVIMKNGFPSNSCEREFGAHRNSVSRGGLRTGQSPPPNRARRPAPAGSEVEATWPAPGPAQLHQLTSNQCGLQRQAISDSAPDRRQQTRNTIPRHPTTNDTARAEPAAALRCNNKPHQRHRVTKKGEEPGKPQHPEDEAKHAATSY